VTGLFHPEMLVFTEALCAEQALAARTRACLIKVEHEAHRAGWDSEESAPTLFRLEAHETKQYVKARADSMMTVMLRATCERTGGNVGAALQHLASTMELAKQSMESLDLLPEGGRDILVRHDANHRFYGYALRVEAWATRGLTSEAREAVKAKRLSEYEHRIELRSITFVARDGLTWSLGRVRGEAPQVMAVRPEGDTEHEGLVPNALGRMTNVIASNPVPVPQRATRNIETRNIDAR
jgi:hypothetical protein